MILNKHYDWFDVMTGLNVNVYIISMLIKYNASTHCQKLLWSLRITNNIAIATHLHNYTKYLPYIYIYFHCIDSALVPLGGVPAHLVQLFCSSVLFALFKVNVKASFIVGIQVKWSGLILHIVVTCLSEPLVSGCTRNSPSCHCVQMLQWTLLSYICVYQHTHTYTSTFLHNIKFIYTLICLQIVL